MRRLDGLPSRDHTGELAFAVRGLGVQGSGNGKIGVAATTYASQASCPSDCVFQNAGCYAEGGWVAQHATRKLASDASAVDVALAEARAIDALAVVPGMPMRLHTVGDCPSDTAARIVSRAAHRYMDRGGGQVWTYTHAWRAVMRESWGRVSVLASCETAAEVHEAFARGYAAALTVEDFPSDRAYHVEDVEVVPCPAQTRHVTCTDCRLCFDDQARWKADKVIGFALHGDGMTMRRARATLRGEEGPKPTRPFIDAWHVEHGDWPTVKQVAAACGVNDSSAWQMLGRMKAERGRILTSV